MGKNWKIRKINLVGSTSTKCTTRESTFATKKYIRDVKYMGTKESKAEQKNEKGEETWWGELIIYTLWNIGTKIQWNLSWVQPTKCS